MVSQLVADIKKTWRIVKSGEGYQDIRWTPVFCGGLGYRENGGAFCFVDLVFFRRIYFRVIEMEAAPFEFMLHSKRAIRVGKEMHAAIPEETRP